MSDFRCKHGTYIGDPYGPDYLCYWCEIGEDPPIRTTRKLNEWAMGELKGRPDAWQEVLEILEHLSADGISGDRGNLELHTDAERLAIYHVTWEPPAAAGDDED
jgi:hypothetical protein